MSNLFLSHFMTSNFCPTFPTYCYYGVLALDASVFHFNSFCVVVRHIVGYDNNSSIVNHVE
jgi:hypothetical protein